MPDYASWARRIVALLIDWFACTLVAVAVLGPREYADNPSVSWVVLGIYFVEAAALTALVQGSFGQLVVGIRVLRTDGRTVSLFAALLRTLMICVVIPPLIFRPDSGRGLHDLATDSAAYRKPEKAG